MTELTWLIDRHTGQLTVEGLTTTDLGALSADLLPPPAAVNCARPHPAQRVLIPTPSLVGDGAAVVLRALRVYHGSVVDGPGRRSVVQLAGCEHHCPGCFVPESHPRAGGVVTPVTAVVAALLDPAGGPRDGVTISGGEPFLQPRGLVALVRALKGRGCHIVIYSGYTYDELVRPPHLSASEVLSRGDVLIDGRFVAALAGDAGEWRGSRNQRAIDLAATRDSGRVVLIHRRESERAD